VAAGAYNFGSSTGANFISIGYMYNLSQRTNVSVGYARTRNEALVRYDMFANSSGNTAIGADPRSISFGLRHTF
jgi:predicted porin